MRIEGFEAFGSMAKGLGSGTLEVIFHSYPCSYADSVSSPLRHESKAVAVITAAVGGLLLRNTPLGSSPLHH